MEKVGDWGAQQQGSRAAEEQKISFSPLPSARLPLLHLPAGCRQHTLKPSILERSP